MIAECNPTLGGRARGWRAGNPEPTSSTIHAMIFTPASRIFGDSWRSRRNSCIMRQTPMLNSARAMMTAALAVAIAAAADEPGPALDEIFRDPPMEVRPSGYWWWLYNNVDKASITRDLEEFRDKGMGAVLLVCSGNWSASPVPHGPQFLSDEWNGLFLHALDEARRLGLKVDMNIAPGWNMGGPWVTPETACRWFLQSETTLEGPQKFAGKLPLPAVNDGYTDKPQLGVAKQVRVPMEKADYRDTSVVAFRIPPGVPQEKLINRRGDLGAKSARSDGSVFVPAEKVMSDPRQPWKASPDDVPIAAGEVVDLTSRLADDGTLNWDVPDGRWVLVRTGHRMTGAMLSVPLPGMEGLENDFLDRAGVEHFFKHTGKVLAELAGPHAGDTLRAFCSDSFEAGYPNWTANMPKHFRHYRGYDMTPYLPVLRGYVVDSAEISERFLHDYRKTIADCMADEHYRRFAELGEPYGIRVRAEPAGPSWSSTMCMDGLKNLGRVDFPQGEFWRKTFVVDGQNVAGKQTATAAHVYGLRTASAEALTSMGRDPAGRSIHWSAYPEIMKPLVDRAFCEGINNMVFHTMTAQKPQDGKPGYEYGAGTHFNPNVTWWAQTAGPWLDYVNRCQALLQRGFFVADVLYYNGDWVPNLAGPKRIDPDLGKGYDYDVCNEEVLLNRLSVDDRGRIVLPDGMSYRLLVLPGDTRMPAEVAIKIGDLVKAGATVVGPRPTSDPGLRNHPACDETVRAIAKELWGGVDGRTVFENQVGKGRVIEGRSLRGILTDDGVPPDFEVEGDKETFIDFIHRCDETADWYFVFNRKQRDEEVTLHFRQSGRRAEHWDPVTGEQRSLSESKAEDGRTRVPMKFGPHQSAFVVFRRGAPAGEGSNVVAHEAVRRIEGSWQVRFDPEWFYPVDGLTGDQAGGRFVFEGLPDWAARPEHAVKYFSGTAVYQKEFEVLEKPAAGGRYFLALGGVSVSARVKLNGVDLGVAWCHPWRVEATGALKPGLNRLEVEVVNTWQNRLIGDGFLPEGQRRTRTNMKHFYLQERRGKKINHPLMPSGLRGPVTLLRRME
jgi:hypothetical protein